MPKNINIKQNTKALPSVSKAEKMAIPMTKTALIGSIWAA
jgi:hypothetical protein